MKKKTSNILQILLPFIGMLTMKILTSGMLALGMPSTLQNVGTGVFLLVFIAFTSNQKRIQEANKAKKRVVMLHTQKAQI